MPKKKRAKRIKGKKGIEREGKKIIVIITTTTTTKFFGQLILL